eukprot:1211522-Heterocapsa_arctica.AAC.1
MRWRVTVRIFRWSPLRQVSVAGAATGWAVRTGSLRSRRFAAIPGGGNPVVGAEHWLRWRTRLGARMAEE